MITTNPNIVISDTRCNLREFGFASSFYCDSWALFKRDAQAYVKPDTTIFHIPSYHGVMIVSVTNQAISDALAGDRASLDERVRYVLFDSTHLPD